MNQEHPSRVCSAVARVSKPAAAGYFTRLESRRAADLEIGDTADLEACATNGPRLGQARFVGIPLKNLQSI